MKLSEIRLAHGNLLARDGHSSEVSSEKRRQIKTRATWRLRIRFKGADPEAVMRVLHHTRRPNSYPLETLAEVSHQDGFNKSTPTTPKVVKQLRT